MEPIIIDIEASGLGRGSYPIEVGVALPGGETHCMIIRPPDEWQHWDRDAEALHGISRDTLMNHGSEPEVVARQLNRWLAEQVVYSDAWGNDSTWLALLYECAGLSRHFQVESLRSLLTDEQVACWHEVKAQVVAESPWRRHRASNDALLLQQTYNRTAALAADHSGAGRHL